MDNQVKILLVDDDADHLSLVERYTSLLGIACRSAPSAPDAIQCLQTDSFDAMVTDLVMPGMDGMELLRHTREHHPGVAGLIKTGFSKKYSYMDVINAGAKDFIAKPFQKDEYEAKLRRVLREKILLRDLLEAKKKAEVANRAKSTFLSTISHELRTPMNGIMGLTQILCAMDLPDKAGGFLRMIADSANRLMNLINQLLDFAALDAGNNDLKPAEFSLESFFEKELPNLDGMAKRKGLPLRIAVDQELALQKLYGDTTALAQILRHLTDNAVKFSEQGKIQIAVSSQDVPDPGSLLLRFSVSDNGCGISREQARSIFSPFTQAEDYMTRRHEGVGLGLAISAKLVHLMHGRIWVESEIDKGAVFFFTAKFGVR